MRILTVFIVLILFPVNVYAEYVIGNDDGIITAEEIRTSYNSNQNWLNNKVPKIDNLEKRERYKRSAQGWLDHLAPYVLLSSVSTIDEVKQHVFFPDEATCLSHVNTSYLDSVKKTGRCARNEWFLKERAASLYYIIVNSRAALFHVTENKVSLALVIEAQAGANYNFQPHFYHRAINGENLLLLHLHGVVVGNGALDDETLVVVNKDKTISLVDTRGMRDQLSNRLKDKYAIHRAHSFLTEDSFVYWASTRSVIESSVIAAEYILEKSELNGEANYALKIDPTKLQIDSRKMNDLGLKKYKKGLYVEAIEYFKKAIQQTPTQYGHFNFNAHLNLGLALLKAGNIDESVRVSELVYDHPEAESHIGYKGNASFNIGLAYEKKGGKYFLSAARDFFKTAYQIDPSPARKKALDRAQNKL